MDFVIDGSNVLLGLRVKRVPSVRALARLLAALDENKKTYRIWFDNSVRHRIGHPQEEKLLDDLLKVLQSSKLVNMAPHADAGIQNDCKEFGCPVINTSDNNDSWAFQPKIYRCRFTGNKERIYVAPAHSRSRSRILEANLLESFVYRGLHFSASEAPAGDGSTVVTISNVRRPPSQNGNLLVLALDASQSMDETDTYDRKSRAAHVNDVLRRSIEELNKSAIAGSLYIAVVAFSSDVLSLSADSNSIFSPVRDWHRWLSSGSAVYETHVERAQTNIRLALDRASDFINQFRSSDEAPKLAGVPSLTVDSLGGANQSRWRDENRHRRDAARSQPS